MAVQGARPTMGQENCNILAPKGRVVRQKSSSNHKNNANTNYAHKQLKCFYANDESLITEFTEFKARVVSHKCMVRGITEVKPKNQKCFLNTAELGLSDYMIYSIILINKEEEFVYILTKHLLQHHSYHWSLTFKNRYGLR